MQWWGSQKQRAICIPLSGGKRAGLPCMSTLVASWWRPSRMKVGAQWALAERHLIVGAAKPSLAPPGMERVHKWENVQEALWGNKKVAKMRVLYERFVLRQRWSWQGRFSSPRNYVKAVTETEGREPQGGIRNRGALSYSVWGKWTVTHAPRLA